MVYLLNKAEGGGASSQYPSVYLLNSHLLFGDTSGWPE